MFDLITSTQNTEALTENVYHGSAMDQQYGDQQVWRPAARWWIACDRTLHVSTISNELWCVFNTESDLLQAGCGTTGLAGLLKHQGSYSLRRWENVGFEEGDAENSYGLVAALLQLMRCALDCIGRAVCISTLFPGGCRWSISQCRSDTILRPVHKIQTRSLSVWAFVSTCVSLLPNLFAPSMRSHNMQEPERTSVT